MKIKSKPFTVAIAPEWMDAVKDRIADHGVSRYRFAREVSDSLACSLHTAECLLAEHGTVIAGNRVPSLPVAIEMAQMAGYDVVLVPKRVPQGVRR